MDRNDLLAATRAEFLRAFLKAIDQSLLRSIMDLKKKADETQSVMTRRRYIDARDILLKHDGEMRREMKTVMEQLIARSFQTAYSTFRPSFFSTYAGNSLSLIDTSTFEDELRIDGITKRFRDSAEEQLRDLNIRIGMLFEQSDIKERENPFRPYLFSRCIITAIGSLALAPDLNLTLSHDVAENLENQIAEIYSCVNALLEENGIEVHLQVKIRKSSTQTGVLYGRVSENDMKTFSSHEWPDNDDPHVGLAGTYRNVDGRAAGPEIPRRKVDQLMDLVKSAAIPAAMPPNGNLGTLPEERQGKPTAGNVGNIATAGWLAGNQVIGDVLRNYFLLGSSTIDIGGTVNCEFDVASGLGIVKNGPLANEIERLQKGSDTSIHESTDRDGAIRNLVLEKRVDLNALTAETSEQMTVDVVGMLFEFIMRDARLPAAVRVHLARLQFFVLGRALQNRAFLTGRAQPFRMLLNRIGSVAFGLRESDAASVKIAAEVRKIVDALLLAGEAGKQDVFSTMLDGFDMFVEQKLFDGEARLVRAIQMFEQAQSRTHCLADTKEKMEQALVGLRIDPYLHTFLADPWVHAIERAERTDHARAQRYRLFVPDLLWSIVPKIMEDDRVQMFALLPIILSSLKEGLALLGWQQERQKDLLDWLVDVHSAALRTGGVSSVKSNLSVMHEHFAEFTADSESHRFPLRAVTDGDDNPHQNEFFREAYRELGSGIEQLDRILEPAGTMSASGEGPGEGSGLGPGHPGKNELEINFTERLRCGIAIEIDIDGNSTGARVNWIDPWASNVLLSLDGRKMPSVAATALLRRLARKGHVRTVEKTPLFERAVYSLLHSAEQMDRAG